jgi:hypothetical protein
MLVHSVRTLSRIVKERRMSEQPTQRQSPPLSDGAPAIVRALAGDIGPRPAGSAAELRAAAVVAAAFEQVGVAAVQLPVRVRAPGSWEVLLYLPLGLAAILLGLAQPVLGAVAGAAVLLACGAELSGTDLLTRLIPRTPARNVLAIVPPQRQAIRRVIVMANLDTVAPAAANRFAASPATAKTASYTLAVLAPFTALLISQVLAGNDVTGLSMASALLTLLWLFRVGWLDWQARGSPGAATNASGIAALVALAEHVGNNPLEWIELWLLAASAGEARGDGLRSFLQSNQFDVDATFFVNVQSVGAGTLAVATREGLIRTHTASPMLARGLAESRVDPAQLIGLGYKLRRRTQAGVAMQAGYDAVTLVGADDDAVIPRDGREDDTVALVDQSQINRATTMLSGLLARLDAEAAERNRLALLARASSAAAADQPEPSGE